MHYFLHVLVLVLALMLVLVLMLAFFQTTNLPMFFVADLSFLYFFVLIFQPTYSTMFLVAVIVLKQVKQGKTLLNVYLLNSLNCLN